MARLRSRTNNHILFYDTIDDLLATDQVRSMSSVTQHVKDVTCLDHSIFVAYVTFRLCRFFPICPNTQSLILSIWRIKSVRLPNFLICTMPSQ